MQNRQTGRRPVAPRNDSPRWPEGYVEVLREAGAIEKTIPYHMAWVRSFFARYPGRRRRDLGRGEIETFLSELSQRPRVTNWQLAQARTALEVYYEQFRGISLDSRDFGAAGMPPVSPRLSSFDSSTKASPTSVALKNNMSTGAVGKRLLTEQTPAGPSGKVLPAATRSSGLRVNWKALDAKVRECLRVAHYAYRTEQSYVMWIRQFVMYHGWRKPSEMGAEEIKAFLKHLAEERQGSASTQNQLIVRGGKGNKDR